MLLNSIAVLVKRLHKHIFKALLKHAASERHYRLETLENIDYRMSVHHSEYQSHKRFCKSVILYCNEKIS